MQDMCIVSSTKKNIPNTDVECKDKRNIGICGKLKEKNESDVEIQLIIVTHGGAV